MTGFSIRIVRNGRGIAPNNDEFNSKIVPINTFEDSESLIWITFVFDLHEHFAPEKKRIKLSIFWDYR